MPTVSMNVPAGRVRAQIVSILTSWGMDPQQVQTSADVMLATDLSGVDSHGISMLMDYQSSREKGKLNVNAKPRIVRENAVTALVDADAGLGHPAAVMGMELAIKKAQTLGVGVVTVRNSHHFGAAGYYASLASKQGLVGMVTSATRSINTVPTRGMVPVLGTNPIAFAAPARRNRAFLLDMATASVAANKVRVYELKGKPVPAGWVLDERGVPVTYTAVYAAEQAHFAAQLGAAYAAPYLGRLEDSGVDGLALITQMQSLVAGSATRLLVASIRSREAYLALLNLGVGSITIPPRLFAELLDHDATLAAERGFLADANFGAAGDSKP